VAGGVVVVYESIGGLLQNPTNVTTAGLVPSAGFGSAVALSGDRMLVGAPGDDTQGAEAGAAYVFELQAGTWQQVAKLLSPNGGPHKRFGASVDIDGDTAVVASTGFSMPSGYSDVAHVFRRSNLAWVYDGELTPSDPAPDQLFGFSVSASDNTVAVGALYHAAAGASGSGSTYVYRRISGSWALEQALTAAWPQANAQFGVAVALEGSTLLVGANGESTTFGAVHAFERLGSAWTEVQVFSATDPVPQGSFGFMLALEGDRALIGAPGNGTGPEGGRVYAFTRSAGSWSQSANLLPLGQPFPSNDAFGNALALDAASMLASDGGQGGPAHVYTFTGIGCPQLVGVPSGVSLQDGGSQQLTLSLPANAGQPYLLLGSISWVPGFSFPAPVDGVLLPLTFDLWTLVTLEYANQAPLFKQTFGVLDGFGNASPKLTFPAGLPAALTGLTLHHAALVFDPLAFQAVVATNAVPWKLVP
jgi:FG-GAP repeat